MVRPMVADFEMRPKRSHFERATTRMLSTMVSVESGTTGVPVLCPGLLWFHWYDAGKQTMDCAHMSVLTYFQGDSAGDPILGAAEKQVEDPAVDCVGDATGA
jgi:hypothetical protein